MLKRATIVFTIGVLFCSVLLLAQERGQRGQNVQLPEGTGKDLVQTTCTQCHALNLVTNAGYSRQDWEQVFTSMVSLPKDKVTTIADYLGKNFPEKAKPQAVVIPGPIKVTIKEWVVPSLGSRPHDPLATPDGMIWWTGQWASVIGRLNPKTGELKEFPTKTPKSGPHGLVADKDGNIWYTGNFVGLIGKLN